MRASDARRWGRPPPAAGGWDITPRARGTTKDDAIRGARRRRHADECGFVAVVVVRSFISRRLENREQNTGDVAARVPPRADTLHRRARAIEPTPRPHRHPSRRPSRPLVPVHVRRARRRCPTLPRTARSREDRRLRVRRPGALPHRHPRIRPLRARLVDDVARGEDPRHARRRHRAVSRAPRRHGG